VNEIINKYGILISQHPYTPNGKKNGKLENSVREFSKIFCANREKLHIFMRNNQLKTFLIPVFINNLIHC